MPTNPTALDPFEGLPVSSAGMEIPGAAGGLREAMKLDPVQLHKGQRVIVVLDTTVDKIRFDPLKDSDGWKRVHVLAVEQGLIAAVSGGDDGDELDGGEAAQFIDRLLTEQRARLKEARDKYDNDLRRAKGQFTIEEEALETEHADGQHAGELRDGCPSCDAERDAAEAEQGGSFDPEDDQA